MNIEILQPAEDSLQAVLQTIEQNQPLYRSPHVGNVNNAELNLLLGIDALGGQVQVELVDSIRGDDRYANPRVALVGDETIVLASRNYAKSRVVGACAIDQSGLDRLATAGIQLDTPIATLQDVHVASLKAAMPPSINVTSSSQFFATLGAEAYLAVLEAADKIIDRPIRAITPEGKIDASDQTTARNDLFGFGDNPIQGRVAPLEAMMALEMAKPVIEQPGQDQRIVHIGGPDMVRYVGQPVIMEPAKLIAAECLAALGIARNITVEYVVPCMKAIIASGDFNSRFNDSVRSQYDVLLQAQVGAV